MKVQYVIQNVVIAFWPSIKCSTLINASPVKIITPWSRLVHVSTASRTRTIGKHVNRPIWRTEKYKANTYIHDNWSRYSLSLSRFRTLVTRHLIGWSMTNTNARTTYIIQKNYIYNIKNPHGLWLKFTECNISRMSGDDLNNKTGYAVKHFFKC